MKKDPKGFSVVEVLLAVAVIGLLGFVGWYAWDNSNKTESGTPTALQPERQEIALKEGYKRYESSSLSIQYPEDWTTYTDKDDSRGRYFKSPDFKDAPSDVSLGITQGYLLEVGIYKPLEGQSYENDLASAPDAQEAHGGTYETIQIDGQNALLHNIKSHGTYWSATAYKNNRAYLFRLHAVDEEKPEVKKLLLSILETVQLK